MVCGRDRRVIAGLGGGGARGVSSAHSIGGDFAAGGGFEPGYEGSGEGPERGGFPEGPRRVGGNGLERGFALHGGKMPQGENPEQ